MDWEQVTIGLEIEMPRSHPDTVIGLHDLLPIDIHDDGSLRKTSYLLGTTQFCVLPITNDAGYDVICSGMYQQRAYGLEIISKPLPVATAREKLPLLARHYKHLPKDNTCSFHLHVDIAGQPWRYVQRLFEWVYHLEAVLFRLSCAGKVHRGVFNDYQYCRPLSNPIGAVWGRTRGPLILIEDLITAPTSSAMAFAWGRTDQYYATDDDRWSIPHYIAHRYHMVNLMSCFRIGTFEWRLFDPLYEYLDIFLDVVLAIHKLAYDSRPDFDPMLLGSRPGITMDEVSEILHLDIHRLWGEDWPDVPTRKFPDAHTGAMIFNKALPITIPHDTGRDIDPLYIR